MSGRKKRNPHDALPLRSCACTPYLSSSTPQTRRGPCQMIDGVTRAQRVWPAGGRGNLQRRDGRAGGQATRIGDAARLVYRCSALARRVLVRGCCARVWTYRKMHRVQKGCCLCFVICDDVYCTSMHFTYKPPSRGFKADVALRNPSPLSSPPQCQTTGTAVGIAAGPSGQARKIGNGHIGRSQASSGL